MRVNVDSQAQNDPRMHLLARHLQINVFEAMGRILRVWFVCYERRSAVVQPIEIDIASDRDGFTEAMIASGLAERDAAGIYVRGVLNRIRFLETQQRKGQKSGEARRQYAEMRAPVQQGFAFGSTGNEPRLNQSSRLGSTYSPAPDLDLDPALDQDHVPRGRGPDDAQGTRKPGKPSVLPVASAENPGPAEVASPPDDAAEGKPAREPPDQAVTLAHLLIGLITDNHPTGRIAKVAPRVRDATALRWADAIDKLQRIDGFSWGEIEGMIVWCQRDSFWRGVILGGDNLRDKWDTMSAQRNRPRGNAGSSQPSVFDVLDEYGKEKDAQAAKEQSDDR